MGARSEALAAQLEEKVQQAMATLEGLSDAEWKKTTADEKWSVGVTAHHIASVPQTISKAIKALLAGESLDFGGKTIDAINAKHAKDYVDCTKAETVDLLKKGAAVAAATVRGLSDNQLAKSGMIVPGAPPMTVEQLITGGLINHLDQHFGSIQKTVGR